MDMDYIQESQNQDQAVNNDQDNVVVGDRFYQIDWAPFNHGALYTGLLYTPYRQPNPPNANQYQQSDAGQVQPHQEILEPEQYVDPALAQKRQLESMIAAVDFTANACINIPPVAIVPIIEYKAMIAFDLLKFCTITKHRLRGLILTGVDSDALRQQLIRELDESWSINCMLIQDLITTARQSAPWSTLAGDLESALLLSGTHQGMTEPLPELEECEV